MASTQEVSFSLPSPYLSSSSSNLHTSAAFQSQGQCPGDRCRERECQHLSTLMARQNDSSSFPFAPPGFHSPPARSKWGPMIPHLGIDDTYFRNESESVNGAWWLGKRWAGRLTFSVRCRSCITFTRFFRRTNTSVRRIPFASIIPLTPIAEQFSCEFRFPVVSSVDH